MVNITAVQKETRSNWRQLCCEVFIASMKNFSGVYYAGISEFHLSTGTFGFLNKFFKKITSVCIILFLSFHS